jgi:hypothetical protein
MGVPTSEVGYTSATTWRGDHEVHKGHVVALAKKKKMTTTHPAPLYARVFMCNLEARER